MTSKIVKYGSPTTVEIDYTEGTTNFYVSAPENTDIFAHWETALADMPEFTVCLSGGLDSQFATNVALALDKKLDIVTFEFKWDGTTVNAYDVLTARDFCRLKGLPDPRNVSVDIKDFLNNKLLGHAEKYRLNSPQVAAQLYAMEQLAPKSPLLLGGDMMGIGFCNGTVTNPYDSRIITPDATYTPAKFKHTDGPFYILAEELNIPVVRDVGLLSPEIFYLMLHRHTKIIEETGTYINTLNSPTTANAYHYKQAYYESFGFEFLTPLSKKTGFEVLKAHMASETGVYDQFDKDYRDPVINLMKNKQLFGLGAEAGKTFFNGNDYASILTEMQNLYNNNDLKPANIYSFDW